MASTETTEASGPSGNEHPHTRPVTRADCRAGLRPCPYSCRYNLLYETDAHGGISLHRAAGRITVGRKASDEEFTAAADTAIEDWTSQPSLLSCALDVAEENPDGVSFEMIAELLRLTHQRVEQIAQAAQLKLERGAAALGELEVANG